MHSTSCDTVCCLLRSHIWQVVGHTTLGPTAVHPRLLSAGGLLALFRSFTQHRGSGLTNPASTRPAMQHRLLPLACLALAFTLAMPPASAANSQVVGVHCGEA